MRRILMILLLGLSGCAPSPQEQYDTALRIVSHEQERLDALRPAYDAARQNAALVVCKEIAGTTPDESATAALQQLESAMNQSPSALTDADETSGKKKKAGDIDDTIDSLLSAQKTFQEQQAALSGPLAKAHEVMDKIKTPGTPEAKRFEEVLAGMPEVQAYKRQEERLDRANKAAEAAEAALSGGAATK